MSRPKKPPDQHSRTVVKTGFASRIRSPDLRSTIEVWVAHISQLYHRASFFFNLYLLRLLRSNLPLPNFNDQSLFTQCLTIGMNSSKSINPELLNTWDLHRHDFPLIPRIRGDTQVTTYFAKKYQTNFLNHIRVPFFSRQFKMLRLLIPHKPTARKVQLMINHRIPFDSTLIRQFPSDLQGWIQSQYDWFDQVEPGKLVNDIWIKKNLNWAVQSVMGVL
jgi:hypothetical protein